MALVSGETRWTVRSVPSYELIATLHGSAPAVTFDAWRVGDQRYYVSDTRKFERTTGWTPRTRLADGLRQLYAWLRDARVATPVAIRKVAT